MPFLIYRDKEGSYHEKELSAKKNSISIGSDPDPAVNDLVLPAELDVAPRQAVVIRSAVNNLPLLVNLTNQNTRVNGRPVVRIQVLRQKDEVQLGQALVTMWEVRIVSARAGDRAIGKPCPVCSKAIQAGEQVVVCPRCPTVTHRLCWFPLEYCANYHYSCGYPIRERILEALSPWVVYERKLDKNSALIRKHKTCQALEEGFQIPFSQGDDMVYCPSCQATYHVVCWLRLERCKFPGCGYEVQNLLNEAFMASYSSGPATAVKQMQGEDHVK